MQYPSWSFSSQQFKKAAVMTWNPFHYHLLDEDRYSLSFLDLKLIDHLYGCSQGCPSGSDNPCQNGGIPMKITDDEEKGQSDGDGKCVCICHEIYEGDLCEKVKDKKVHRRIDVIGDPEELSAKLVEEQEMYNSFRCGFFAASNASEGELTTPGYPKRENVLDSCTWWFKLPVGKRVEVEFEDFSIAGRNDNEQARWFGLCSFERLEVWLDFKDYETEM